jgi:glycosyltransferase involved in cell wall biosynthesis
MAFYGRQLAARLPVGELRTDVNLRSADRFGTPPLSRAAARALVHDVGFARRLRALEAVPHLTHHHTLRYALARRGPYVVTVHDLIRFTDATGATTNIAPLNARDRVGVALDAEAARHAAGVIAPSRSTARALVAQLGVAAQDVAVVPLGVDPARFRPDAGPRPLAAPYVLFVGSEHPRKELPTLLRAFARLRGRRGVPAGLRLAKVGDAGDPEAPFAVAARRTVRELGLEDDVVFAGRVPDDELPRWYAHAECLAFASRAEGFGLPAVEAMACGCPVVGSTEAALPEVVGDAGLLVPAGDADALARAIGEVLGDPVTRLGLVVAGRERARELTWERTARETLAVYDAVLAGTCAADAVNPDGALAASASSAR